MGHQDALMIQDMQNILTLQVPACKTAICFTFILIIMPFSQGNHNISMFESSFFIFAVPLVLVCATALKLF
jgi:hypothetical protein